MTTSDWHYSWSVVERVLLLSVRSGSKGGGAIAPLKPTEATSFTIILYNSENSTRDIRPFCLPSFCHSSVVKYTSSLLQ